MTPWTIEEHVALVRSGEASALELTKRMVDRVSRLDDDLNAYTDITLQRALAEAAAQDAMRAAGETLPVLAGAPYAVKNLFDIQNVTTLCGAKVHADRPPATADAPLVARVRDAGAVLLGALNMDAYAYGFTTENTHFGVTHNPHDHGRVAGGSSGGSGAAVSGGLATFSLGSDTNGSIRVPSSFCGIFGLKPTFGRLTRAGSIPFVASLDHLGPFARTSRDLSLLYDVLQGPDPNDPACAQRPVEPTFPHVEEWKPATRVALLGGHFSQWADPDARDAAIRAAKALGAMDETELPEAHRARSAAFMITASEAGSLYLNDLRDRPDDFEPLTRERLTAGALLPAAWYVRAQRFRTWFREATAKVFQKYDLLIAPATPRVATPIGAETMTINGVEMPVRPNIGLLTQPLSFIGLPIAVAPLWTGAELPMGVQLIAAPWNEKLCLQAARRLEAAGLAYAKTPPQS